MLFIAEEINHIDLVDYTKYYITNNERHIIFYVFNKFDYKFDYKY